jgi:hypothetical protein
MRRAITIAFILICAGCLDPYAPPASSGNLNALVVDGFIDANGTASVTLSRSIPLDGKDAPPFEFEAVVTIESSNGDTFSLQEDKDGVYSASALVVDKTATYTLHIVTIDENEYQSDPMKIYSTPAIDSVYWTINGAERLEIRADSHNDDPENTGYYLLNAIETYEYHAAVFCHFKLINHVAYERLPEEEVFVCYRDERTPNVLASTKGLRNNRVTGVKVSVIDRKSPKISVPRYSILVRQIAIGEEEYTYQRLLIASTEQQGSLFAQIPGRIPSNMHSIKDPNEYVLGYFRAQEVKELRYFIDTYTHPIPGDFYQKVYELGCQPEATCFYSDPSAPTSGGCVPPEAVSDAAGIVSATPGQPGFVFVPPGCGDCRSKGGTTTKPSYWQ